MATIRDLLPSVERSYKMPVWALLLVYPFLSFPWHPISPLLSAAAADTGSTSKKVYATQQQSGKDTGTSKLTRKKVIEKNGTESMLGTFTKKYEFSPMLTPLVDIVSKENRAFYGSFPRSSRLSDGRAQQLQVVNLKQSHNSFSYGAEYRYVGKSAIKPKDYRKLTKGHYNLRNDQEGLEIWAAREFGPIRLTGFLSRFWDNVDNSPTRYRMFTSQTGMAVDYKTPSLPIYLSFSHSRGASRSTTKPGDSKANDSSREIYDGSLYYYGGNKFDATLSSSYALSEELYDSERETESYWHEVSASFRPTWNITITPAVSYGEDRYRWYGERTEMPSASLCTTYSGLFDAIDLSLWGSYFRMKSTDGYLDETTLDSSVEINWNTKDLLVPEIKWALEIGYQRYTDNIYPDSSYDALSASLFLEMPF